MATADEQPAELHPRNEATAVGSSMLRDPFGASHLAAAAPCTEAAVHEDDTRPYMLSVAALEASSIKAYAPMWKELRPCGVRDPESLHEWLHAKADVINKFNVAKASMKATHVTMNGGRFSIIENEAEFLQWYAAALTLSKRVWFVEQLTPVFRFFVDLDVAQVHGLPERYMKALACIVNNAVLRFFPDVAAHQPPPLPEEATEYDDASEEEGSDRELPSAASAHAARRRGAAASDPASAAREEPTIAVRNNAGEVVLVPAAQALRCIVCTTSYKYINAKDDKPEMVKSGVHLLWPHVYVTRDDALDMRESIMVDLEKAFGKRVHPNNSWSDVVDASVYGSGNAGTKGSGLRMLGSRKTDPCPTCKSKGNIKKADGSEVRCAMCNGYRRVDTGRPYYPLCVLDSYGVRDVAAEAAYRGSMHALILDTKVRTRYEERPAEPRFVVPEHAPRHLSSAALTGRKRSRAAAAASAGGAVKPADPKLARYTRMELSNSSPEWDALQSLVRGAASGRYAKSLLSTVTTNARMDEFIVHINGEMCRFCHNIGREHSSNRIFFVVDKTRLVQRCHDAAPEATPEMRYGRCADYVCDLGPLPVQYVSKLFPACAGAALDGGSTGAGGSAGDGFGAGVEEDGGDDEAALDVRQQRDRKLQRLMQLTDTLSADLYGKMWSTTLTTSAGEHIVATQTRLLRASTKAALAIGDYRYTKHAKQYAIDPWALGTNCTRTLKAMGITVEMSVTVPGGAGSGAAGEMEAGLAGGGDADDALGRRIIKSLKRLERRLFDTLQCAVLQFAAPMPPEEAQRALCGCGSEAGPFDALVSARVRALAGTSGIPWRPGAALGAESAAGAARLRRYDDEAQAPAAAAGEHAQSSQAAGAAAEAASAARAPTTAVVPAFSFSRRAARGLVTDAIRGSGGLDGGAPGSSGSTVMTGGVGASSVSSRAALSSSNVHADVRGAYEALFGEQLDRLVMSAQLRTAQVGVLHEALTKSRLQPALLEEDLAKELARICAARYDEPKKESSRLSGFGWTHLHLATHMDRFLRARLQAFGMVLRTQDAATLASSLGAEDDGLTRSFSQAAGMIRTCERLEEDAAAAAAAAAAESAHAEDHLLNHAS